MSAQHRTFKMELTAVHEVLDPPKLEPMADRKPDGQEVEVQTGLASSAQPVPLASLASISPTVQSRLPADVQNKFAFEYVLLPLQAPRERSLSPQTFGLPNVNVFVHPRFPQDLVDFGAERTAVVSAQQRA